MLRHSTYFVIRISTFVIHAAVPELPDFTVYVEALERQTGGKLLADRSLKDDWPRTIEEWEGA